jgi:hypothetical protein
MEKPKDLKPFPNERYPEEDEDVGVIACPKCLEPEPDCKYSRQIRGAVVEGDALFWKCSHCGYEWLTECADAE